MRGIEQRSVDVNVAETQLRAALNHIIRLERFFPAHEHSEIITGLRSVISALQPRGIRIRRTARLRSRIVHRGKFMH